MNLLNLGVNQVFFDAVANGAQNSTAFALPTLATQVSWQTSFGSAPASVTLQLQTSLDNIVWSTIDTSTNVAGESRTINTSALFVRVRENAVSGGSTTTVNVVCKSGVVGNVLTPSSVTDGSLALFDGTTGSKLKELAFPANANQVLKGNGTFGTIAGTGDVVGPSSATDNHVAFFNGATGKLIKDSGLALSGSNTGDQFGSTTASKLLGRGSAGGTGAAQEITLGTNLSLSGTTLNATGGGSTNPAGSGTEIQYRFNATTFGAISGSSVSGSDVAFASNASATSFIGTDATTQVLQTAINAPGNVSLTLGDPGSVTNGDHEVYVVFTKSPASGVPNQATLPSPAATITVTGNSAMVLNYGSLGVFPFAAPFMEVYVTKAGETGPENAHYFADIDSGVASPYIIDVDDASLTGDSPYGTGTTYGVFLGRDGDIGGIAVSDQIGNYGSDFTLIQPVFNGSDETPAIRIGDTNFGYVDFDLYDKNAILPSSNQPDLGSVDLPFGKLFANGDALIGGSVTATDFIVSGSRFKSDNVNAHTGGLAVYDVDGAAYQDFLIWTNGNTPAVTLGPPTGGTLEVKASVFKSSDGSSGATASIIIPAVATITVKNGLITAVV